MSSMKDVARLAGVSVMTVSRVVNQSAPVDEQTRRKVENAIQKLQYKPNLLARRLRQQTSPPLTVAPYDLYEKYREYAKTALPYQGQPGNGKRLGFASIFGTLPFCVEVEQDIRKQSYLAGFHEADLLILDNHYDIDVALKNAELKFSQRPHILSSIRRTSKSTISSQQNSLRSKSP